MYARTNTQTHKQTHAAEKSPPGVVDSEYYCYTLIGVNAAAAPAHVGFNITGLRRGLVAGGTSSFKPGFPSQVVAKRIFNNGGYSLNLTATSTSSTTSGTTSDTIGDYYVEDFIDARAANVYRIGCDVRGAMRQQKQQQQQQHQEEVKQQQQQEEQEQEQTSEDALNYIVGGGDFEGGMVDTQQPGRFQMLSGGWYSTVSLIVVNKRQVM